MDYTKKAADVLAALQKKGMAMTLRQTAGGTFNRATGSYTGATTTDYSAWGLIQSRTMDRGGDTGGRFNGILVQTDDEFILLAASGLTVTPAPGDLLVISGVIYNLVALIDVRPGGVVLFYRLLVRK